jgi:hypothetical protein
VYIILWIVVPKARTTAEKLEMRGEKGQHFQHRKVHPRRAPRVKKNIENFSEETRENLKKKKTVMRWKTPWRA